MNYRQRSRRKRFLAVGIGIVAILVLVSIFSVPLLTPIATPLRSVGSVFTHSRQFLAHAGESVSLIAKPTRLLIEEQRALREQIEHLIQKEAENSFLREERLRLLKLLEQKAHTERIPARVLAAPPANPYDMLSVRIEGTSPQINTLVFAENGFSVLGTVVRRSDTHAEVELFSNATTETPVRIGSEHIPAVLIGEGGGSMVAHVADDVPITEGANVLLDGTSAPYLVGKVVYIELHPNDAEKTLHIQLSSNIFTLTDVLLSSEIRYDPQRTEKEED